jgi:XTP/dITP diphosphohydrolase
MTIKTEQIKKREPSLTDLVIATYNPGKIRELSSLLSNLPLQIHSLKEFPSIVEVEETGSTFSENSLLKATSYAKQTGYWALADDSGLEVDALNGRPGVLSARYAGEHASDNERNMRLLEELSKIPDDKRQARFICVIALSNPDGDKTYTFKGTCEGRIANSPEGNEGFGYDPIFIPNGYNQTFGVLPKEIKQSISHRASALKATLDFLHRGLL